VLTLLATADLQPAEALEKRVALVIGMSDYQHLGSLNNPVAAALKAHGFLVSAVSFSFFLCAPIDAS